MIGLRSRICVIWFVLFQTKQLVRLSQQELMDCSWGEGNNACDGGEDFRAYEWIMKHGLASEEDYGPYLAVVSSVHLTLDRCIVRF